MLDTIYEEKILTSKDATINPKAVATCNRERMKRLLLVPLHAYHSLIESANRALGVGRVPRKKIEGQWP